MHLSFSIFLMRVKTHQRVSWVAVLYVLIALGLLSSPVQGQEDMKQTARLILLTPTPQQYLDDIIEDLPDDIIDAFNDFYTCGKAGNQGELTVQSLPKNSFEEIGIYNDMKTNKRSIKDFLKTKQAKKYFEIKKTDYLIVTSIKALEGDVWKIKWVFVKFYDGKTRMHQGYEQFKFTEPEALYDFFADELPGIMVHDFDSSVKPSDLCRKIEPTVLVTSCFYHRTPDGKPKKILDRLQEDLPSLLLPLLEKKNVFENYKIVAYDFPHKCSEVSDGMYRDIIDAHDANYLVAAYMHMEDNMNYIYFRITYVPKRIQDKQTKPPEPQEHLERYDSQVMAKKVADMIEKQWPF